jgi:OFA family oxalate/formate antiporter-like MFS transporter
MMYTAKGTASLLVPLSSVLATATGSWHAVFIVASIMNGAAALMAWFVLRPMRRAQMDASALPVQESASHADRTTLAGQPAR